uniref:hypothetical protein n=1 Tax=Herbidospora sakaeratensis TaxID=564415 RepID=UPI000782A951|nr:hypothetical protein [Herbidospora sakaeratensis]
MIRTVIVALYGLAVVVAAVVSMVGGDLAPLSVVTGLGPWWARNFAGDFTVPLLLVVGALNAWLLWELLATRRTRDRTVRWLRRLLYAEVVMDLAGWALLGELGELADAVAGLGPLVLGLCVGVAVSLAFPKVSRAYRVTLLVLAVLMAVPWGLAFSPVVVMLVPVVSSPAWWVMVLLAQRRDGRWSALTVGLGWCSLVLGSASWVVPMVGMSLFPALGIVSSLWAARTAREADRQSGDRPLGVRRPVRPERPPRFGEPSGPGVRPA